MANEEIIIETRSYEYLTNDSKHGFYDSENTWWPTVTHYLEAKKFEGTQYEDIIRQAKTARQARRLTRERNVLVMVATRNDEDIGAVYDIERRKVYGVKRNGYIMKTGWNDTRKEYLRKALQYKFYQHPRLQQKLMGTYPRPIRSCNGDQTADFLMEMRDLFCERQPPQAAVPLKKKSAPKSLQSTKVTDINLDVANSKQCQKIRDILMRLSKYISEMEGWDRVFSEMVDDAIFNIYPKYLSQMRNIERLSSKNDHPNLNAYAAKTRKLFIHIDLFQRDTDTPSQKIANFIFWCTYRDGRAEAILRKIHRFTSVQNVDGSINFDTVYPPVMIPPGRRWYRNKQPPKLK